MSERQRAPGRTGSGSLDERPESIGVTGVRSDGGVSSLGGEAIGGVAIGADGLSLGIARSGMLPAGTGGIGLGAEAGGVDCAPTGNTASHASKAPSTIDLNLTGQSPAVEPR